MATGIATAADTPSSSSSVLTNWDSSSTEIPLDVFDNLFLRHVSHYNSFDESQKAGGRRQEAGENWLPCGRF